MMASSNRHWPSMFKSKPNYTTHHDHHFQSHGCSNHRSSSYTSGCDDERTPEPKPRWNPKPEQIRILESIFNSGLVNPPRDEIRRIRARLQEYGQVGDANVFYWFQNRKSRSKHKNRQRQPPYESAVKAAATSSSSSKSSRFFVNSPTVLVNQQTQVCLGEGGGRQSSLHHHHVEFFQEPFFLPVVQPKHQQAPAVPTGACSTQGFCFSELDTMIDQESHHVNDNETVARGKEVEEENVIKMLNHTIAPAPAPAPLAATTQVVSPTLTTTSVTSNLNDLQGVEELAGTRKSIVFINDVPYEVDVGPFNVNEAFGGNNIVLVDSSGQTVMTDEWGVTLESLQHGAFYYLVRAFADDHAGTAVDMV